MNRSRTLRIIFCIVSACLLVCIVVAFFAAKNLFSDQGVQRVPVSAVNVRDSRAAQMKTATALSRIRNARPDSPPEELRLTQDEFNALTETLLNLSGQVSKEMSVHGIRLQDTAVRLNDSSLRLFYSRDTKVNTPFGSRINFEIDMDLRIENGASQMTLGRTRMGGMAMPSAMRAKIEEGWRRFQQTPEHRKMLDSIESFSVENGELHVKYRPYEARKNFAPSALKTAEMLLNPFGAF